MNLTLLILSIAAFVLFLMGALVVFLRSMARTGQYLPSWRITDHGIRCYDCGVMMLNGRPPYARGVCSICKNHYY